MVWALVPALDVGPALDAGPALDVGPVLDIGPLVELMARVGDGRPVSGSVGGFSIAWPPAVRRAAVGPSVTGPAAGSEPSLGPPASHQTATVRTTASATAKSRRTQYTRGGRGPAGRITVLTW